MSSTGTQPPHLPAHTSYVSTPEGNFHLCWPCTRARRDRGEAIGVPVVDAVRLLGTLANRPHDPPCHDCAERAALGPLARLEA